MLNNPPITTHVPRAGRDWKPMAAAGATDPAAALWFEEVLGIAFEFAGVILLAALAGVIFLFNHFVFRSRAPGEGDRDDAGEKGRRE